MRQVESEIWHQSLIIQARGREIPMLEEVELFKEILLFFWYGKVDW